MTYIAHPVKQLDGGPFASGNCVAASDAMLLDRSSAGAIRTTGSHIRALTGDVLGGLTLNQVAFVNRATYGIGGEYQHQFSWAQLPAASRNRGFILLGYYGFLANTRYDCFKGGFFGNHAIWINGRNANGTWRGADPGADGRPDGHGHVPLGYQDYPDALLRSFAGNLITSTGPIHRLGLGFAQVLFSTPDGPTNQPNVPSVVPTWPTPAEVNVMIAPAWGTTGTHRISLAKGQPLFRSPGGKRVTAMGSAGSPPYLGKAGSGWGAVLIGTGVPYTDKQTRPTILYVPLAAGPIS